MRHAKLEGMISATSYLSQIYDIDHARARSTSLVWRSMSSLRFQVFPKILAGNNDLGIYEVNVKNGLVFGARIASDGTFAIGAEPPFLADLGEFSLWLFNLEHRHLQWSVWSPESQTFVGPSHHFMYAMRLIMKAFETRDW